MLQILIISSCTKAKKYSYTKQLNCNKFQITNDIENLVKEYQEISCRAKLLYEGSQHKNILKGIEILRNYLKIDFYILSAGFGIINEEEIIPAYECSFSKMKKQEIIERSIKLNISNIFKKLLSKNYDIIYLALGKKYLQAIPDWDRIIDTITIAFTKSKNDKVISIKANNEIVSKYKKSGYKVHGTIAFKGDFLRIIGEKISNEPNPNKKLEILLNSKEKLAKFLHEEILVSNLLEKGNPIQG